MNHSTLPESAADTITNLDLYLGSCLRMPLPPFPSASIKAKSHSNDEDRIAGTGDIWRLADFCYAAADTGYDGWFGEDQFTYRTDPVKSMALSKELFLNVMRKALLIYAAKNELVKAQSTGDAIATIEFTKRFIL